MLYGTSRKQISYEKLLLSMVSLWTPVYQRRTDMDTCLVLAHYAIGSNKDEKRPHSHVGFARGINFTSLKDQKPAEHGSTWFPAPSCPCLQSVPVTLLLGETGKKHNLGFLKKLQAGWKMESFK